MTDPKYKIIVMRLGERYIVRPGMYTVDRSILDKWLKNE